MVSLCVVNAVTLIGYSWAVFRIDDIPRVRGLLTSRRSMITAFVMAVCVQLLLQAMEGRIDNPYLLLLVAGAAGGLIYTVLLMLTERMLLKKLLELAGSRRLARPA